MNGKTPLPETDEQDRETPKARPGDAVRLYARDGEWFFDGFVLSVDEAGVVARFPNRTAVFAPDALRETWVSMQRVLVAQEAECLDIPKSG